MSKKGENKNISLIPVANNSLAKLNLSFELTNKLLDERAIKYFNLGFYYLHTAVLKKTNENYYLELVNNPHYLEQEYFGGDSINKPNDYLDAINNFDKAIELNPNFKLAYNYRGVAKLNLVEKYNDKWWNETEIDLRTAIKIDENNSFAYKNIGILFESYWEYEWSFVYGASMALKYYDKAIEINNKYWLVYLLRADALISSIDDYPLEEEVLTKKSNKDYNTIIANINANNAQSYVIRGKAKGGIGDYEGAIDDFGNASKLGIKSESMYSFSSLYKSFLGDFKGAIDDISKAILITPANSEYYKRRADYFYELKKYKIAILDYNKSLELEPNNRFSFWYRGRTKEVIGDIKGAKCDFDKFIELEKLDEEKTKMI